MSLTMTMIVAALEALIVVGVLFFRFRTGRARSGNIRKSVAEYLDKLTSASDALQQLTNELALKQELEDLVARLEALRQNLKVEKGRVAITYAELETVETRLRELHEIEREIQASGLETQEELKILEARERELQKRSESLRSQLDSSNQQIEMLAAELSGSPEVKAEVEKIQRELEQAQSKIEEIGGDIELGNKLYLSLKRQYDALDIEYAQLYEKYAMQLEAPPQ